LKKRRAYENIFFPIIPLSNFVREGELKGVSKKEMCHKKINSKNKLHPNNKFYYF